MEMQSSINISSAVHIDLKTSIGHNNEIDQIIMLAKVLHMLSLTLCCANCFGAIQDDENTAITHSLLGSVFFVFCCLPQCFGDSCCL